MEGPHIPNHFHAFQQDPIPLPHMSSLHPQTMDMQQDCVDRARAYKSRNKRPCDFCRYKKAACHLDSQPPCELCIRYGKDCTFVESPAKRRRPNESNGTHGHSKSDGSFDQGMRGHRNSMSGPFVNGGSMELHHDILGWDSGMQPFSMPSMSHIHMTPAMGPSDFPQFDPALYQEPMQFDGFEPAVSLSTTIDMTTNKPASLREQRSSVENTSPSSQPAHLAVNLQLPFDTTSGEPSLDSQESSNAQVVGMSGEQDPYLLSRYRYDQYNEATFQSIRMRKMNDASSNDGGVPTFFTIAHNALASKAQPSERSEQLDLYRAQLEEMVREDVGKRLIKLFYKYVQPYFPVCFREGRYERDEDGIGRQRDTPVCILAALYGHALPFCAWDEKLCVDVYTPPSADALFKIAWLACQPLMHTPSLAVVETILLMVQRRPTNKHVSDTPMKWVMMGTAYSLAQALGLNRDPSDWPLPSWEIKVRKRLAWATFIQEKWLALNFGRSSHIAADDWDVQPLTEADLAHPDRDGPDAVVGYNGQHFIKLAELTVIVDDIMKEMFSLRATKRLQNAIDLTLEVAKPLRMRLTEWSHTLPPGILPQTTPPSPESLRRKSVSSHELDGNGSLYLAYVTANIELFRAMLRPKVDDVNSMAIGALRTGAVMMARELHDFLEGLNARELEAFWASCELRG